MGPGLPRPRLPAWLVVGDAQDADSEACAGNGDRPRRLLEREPGSPSEDTGTVQGYNTSATYAGDAARFNAADRSRSDHNLDLSALARYVASARQTYEGGYSRKTRSPSLYER